MSKEIMLSGWVSVVPNKMVKEWIKKKYIPNNKILNFTESNKKENDGIVFYRMDNSKGLSYSDYKWVKKEEFDKYKKTGYVNSRKTLMLSQEHYNLMNSEVREWYNEVFAYIEKWLKDNDFSYENHRISCIKEKFGQFRVYFNGLTSKEKEKIEKFKKQTEKKIDCVCMFG